MLYLHFKYINSCWMFALIMLLTYVFGKCTGRKFPMDWKEIKECYSEIKADIYGGV